jgi:hypothetical protein
MNETPEAQEKNAAISEDEFESFSSEVDNIDQDPENVNKIDFKADNFTGNTHTSANDSDLNLKLAIVRLKRRFPKLKFKKTNEILEELEEYDTETLQTILYNLHFECQQYNGQPVAKGLLTGTGTIIENIVPGIEPKLVDRLLDDEGLLIDVQELCDSYMGTPPAIVSIIGKILSHLWEQKKEIVDEKEDRPRKKRRTKKDKV